MKSVILVEGKEPPFACHHSFQCPLRSEVMLVFGCSVIFSVWQFLREDRLAKLLPYPSASVLSAQNLRVFPRHMWSATCWGVSEVKRRVGFIRLLYAELACRAVL